MIVDKWDRRFLQLAWHVATWSKDPSTKVGCALVSPRKIVTGLGYNGLPRGVEDAPERYQRREIKYLMTQHAEANAVMNAAAATRHCTAYVTHHPCANCAGLLIQAGIGRIVTHTPEAGLAERFKDSFDAARAMLREAHVTVVEIAPSAGLAT